MTLSILFAVWLGTAGMNTATAHPTRIFVGSPPAPVVSGEVWLVANRWGAYPAVLVASIHNGKLETRSNVRFPRYWDQAFDYKLLVAIAGQPTVKPQSTYEAFGYGPLERPEYLKEFPIIYISPPLPAKNLGKDWEKALGEIGRSNGNVLTLPSPARRTIRLEYPDGKPLAGAEVTISLFGSRENHCGVAVGIPLGTFKADANGEIEFVATGSPLALGRRYFEEKPEGPAGTRLMLRDELVTGPAAHVTLKQLWTVPAYPYLLRLQTKDHRPVVGAQLSACLNFGGCGAGCGPLARGKTSDKSGTIRFVNEDLREMRSITVTNAAGRKRDLTTPEMRELLVHHQLVLTW